MKRRDFISLLGGATVAWPLAARAQQLPLIGVLSSRSAKDPAKLIAAFQDGLRTSGLIDGANTKIEYRYADGEYDKLPVLAAELIKLQPKVIVTTGSEPSALAAQASTSTIPIVFVIGGDPVKFGLVPNLNRPPGNITGVSASSSVLVSKRVELLHELLPQVRAIAFLANPKSPNAETDTANALEAARKLGLELHVLSASVEDELEPAFAEARDKKVGGLSVNLDPFFGTVRNRIFALADQFRIPTIYFYGYYAREGGLIAYGPDLADSYRQAGIYAAKIIGGKKPAELPVMLPTKFELVINLKTAKALGLTVPAALLVAADEVIELGSPASPPG